MQFLFFPKILKYFININIETYCPYYTVAMWKLLIVQVRPELLIWIADFLPGRQQCVKYGGTVSKWSATTSGVPQSVKVAPGVFLAMVNQETTSAPRRWKYVDDVTAGESRAITNQGDTKLHKAMFSIMRDMPPRTTCHSTCQSVPPRNSP